MKIEEVEVLVFYISNYSPKMLQSSAILGVNQMLNNLFYVK